MGHESDKTLPVLFRERESLMRRFAISRNDGDVATSIAPLLNIVRHDFCLWPNKSLETTPVGRFWFIRFGLLCFHIFSSGVAQLFSLGGLRSSHIKL